MVVLAKRDAADWVKTVNGHDSVHDTWACLLAAEGIVKNAGTWAALKAAAQTFR